MNAAEAELSQIAEALKAAGGSGDDGEELVEAGFTVAEAREWTHVWGRTQDVSAKSIIRMKQAGLTPTIARALSVRDGITANEAIARYTTIMEDPEISLLASRYPAALQTLEQGLCDHPEVSQRTVSSLLSDFNRGRIRTANQEERIQLALLVAGAMRKWNTNYFVDHDDLLNMQATFNLTGLDWEKATKLLLPLVGRSTDPVLAAQLLDAIWNTHPNYIPPDTAFAAGGNVLLAIAPTLLTRLSQEQVSELTGRLWNDPTDPHDGKDWSRKLLTRAPDQQVERYAKALSDLAGAFENWEDNLYPLSVLAANTEEAGLERYNQTKELFNHLPEHWIILMASWDSPENLERTFGKLQPNQLTALLECGSTARRETRANLCTVLDSYLEVGASLEQAAWLTFGQRPGGHLLNLDPAQVERVLALDANGWNALYLTSCLGGSEPSVKRAEALCRQLPLTSLADKITLGRIRILSDTLTFSEWLKETLAKNPTANVETLLALSEGFEKPTKASWFNRRELENHMPSAVYSKEQSIRWVKDWNESLEKAGLSEAGTYLELEQTPNQPKARVETTASAKAVDRVNACKERYGQAALDFDTYFTMPALMAKGYEPTEAFLETLVAFEDAWRDGSISQTELDEKAQAVEQALEQAITKAHLAGIRYLHENDPDTAIAVHEAAAKIGKAQQMALRGQDDVEKAAGKAAAARLVEEATSKLARSLGGPAELAARLQIESTPVKTRTRTARSTGGLQVAGA